MAISTAAALIGSAVIGGVASASSASKAAKAQQAAANQANATEWAMYDQTREDQAPYREAGYSALNRLQELLGTGGNAGAAGYGSLTKQFDGASLASDPGYQFRMSQGQTALDRSLSAGGGMYSGAAIKAAQRYAQDYGSQEFTNAFNRNQAQNNSLYNMLSGVSGTGQASLAQTGAAGQNTANQVSSNLIGAGNARASSYIAQGNALSGMVNGGLYGMSRMGGAGRTSAPWGQSTASAWEGYM